MDTLHTVLRSLRQETRPRRDHLDVFREFLNTIERATRRRNPPPGTKAGKVKVRRGRK